MSEWHRKWCDFLNPDLILEFGGVFLVLVFFGSVSIPPKESVQMDVGSWRSVLCNCYHNGI